MELYFEKKMSQLFKGWTASVACKISFVTEVVMSTQEFRDF